MRKRNSLRNLFVSLILGVISIAVTFVTQKIFITTLGLEYAGVNLLFTGIISVLAIAELGIASSIIYHLYEPLHTKNWPRVGQLMAFYKKGYRLVAGTIAIIGLIMLPWIGSFTDAEVEPGLQIIFAIFILDAAISYLMSYKRSLLYADQRNYLINIVRIGVLVVLNLLQILILIATQDYLLFMTLKVLSTLTENVIISRIIDKLYPNVLNTSSGQPLDQQTKVDIFKKIRGLAYHRLATFAVNGTDAIVISMFLGASVAGLYSNYYVVVAAINSLFSQFSTAITASVGNLLIEKDIVHAGKVFDRLQFAYYVIGTVVVACFITGVNPFVHWWLGKEYVLDFEVVFVLGIVLYLTVMRPAFHSFKTAAGIFYEDRYIAVLEAVVNLVASVMLVQIYGLAGVFMGTAISSLVLHLYSYPKYVYSAILKREYRQYYLDFLNKIILAFILIAICVYVTGIITVSGPATEFLVNISVSSTIVLVSYSILFMQKNEYKYYLKLLLSAVNR